MKNDIFQSKNVMGKRFYTKSSFYSWPSFVIEIIDIDYNTFDCKVLYNDFAIDGPNFYELDAGETFLIPIEDLNYYDFKELKYFDISNIDKEIKNLEDKKNIFTDMKAKTVNEVLTFSDQESFDTSGELRAEERYDGWYVLGNNMMIPVDSLEDANKTIIKLGGKPGQATHYNIDFTNEAFEDVFQPRSEEELKKTSRRILSQFENGEIDLGLLNVDNINHADQKITLSQSWERSTSETMLFFDYNQINKHSEFEFELEIVIDLKNGTISGEGIVTHDDVPNWSRKTIIGPEGISGDMARTLSDIGNAIGEEIEYNDAHVDSIKDFLGEPNDEVDDDFDDDDYEYTHF